VSITKRTLAIFAIAAAAAIGLTSPAAADSHTTGGTMTTQDSHAFAVPSE
jgi:ABC-type sugar transport system substrate-binding protein